MNVCVVIMWNGNARGRGGHPLGARLLEAAGLLTRFGPNDGERVQMCAPHNVHTIIRILFSAEGRVLVVL